MRFPRYFQVIHHLSGFEPALAARDGEPVKIETARDVRTALESMNLASWSPRLPRPLPIASADIKGWLASPRHPIAAACRWSVYNYLLATPDSALMFLDNIATIGGRPIAAVRPEEFQERMRLSARIQDHVLDRLKETGLL